MATKPNPFLVICGQNIVPLSDSGGEQVVIYEGPLSLGEVPSGGVPVVLAVGEGKEASIRGAVHVSDTYLGIDLFDGSTWFGSGFNAVCGSSPSGQIYVRLLGKVVIVDNGDSGGGGVISGFSGSRNGFRKFLKKGARRKTRWQKNWKKVSDVLGRFWPWSYKK